MLWELIQGRARRATDKRQAGVVATWSLLSLVEYIIGSARGPWAVAAAWVATTSALYVLEVSRDRTVEQQVDRQRTRFKHDPRYLDSVLHYRFGYETGDPAMQVRQMSKTSEQWFSIWLHEMPIDNPQPVPKPWPIKQIYFLLSLTALALYGTRSLLAHTHLGISPDQAPALIAASVGVPGLITAVLVAVPRVIRAWGAASKDTGAGEAAKIRAQAELRRAEAEYLRAQRALPPLPAVPSPGDPAELPPSNSNAPDSAAPEPKP